MKTESLITLLPITLGLVAAGTFRMLIHAYADAGRPTPQPAISVAESSALESSSRVNVKSLAGNLEFLGDKARLDYNIQP